MIDALVRGGRVVSGSGVQEADLAIQDGKISGVVQRGLISEAGRIIEAEGKLVLPGVVDSHFHCRTRLAVPLVDDMLTGTTSAAYGGVTTVIAYVWGPRGEPFAQAIETFKEEAASKAMIDFSIHCGLRPEMELLRGIPQVLDLGVYSFKFQMDYRRIALSKFASNSSRVGTGISWRLGVFCVLGSFTIEQG